MNTWEILVGDCREVLRSMPAQSVHCCVTSPPYYNLRDYGVDGQIGLEETVDEYVTELVGVFAEIRRVLRDDGVAWLNLADSYAGSWGAQGHRETPATISRNQIRNHPKRAQNTGSIPPNAGYKPKDLLMVPALVALALRRDGWYLRDEIIWHKPAPMPTSARDRTCRAHEVIYLLTKRRTYYYDQQAIAESSVSDHDSGNGYARPEQLARGGRGQVDGWTREDNPTRIKRSVWTVGTANFADAHFATFPPKLIEPCILAGAPERACGECGAPWVRVVEKGPPAPEPNGRNPAKRLEPGQAGNVGAGNMGFRASRLSGQEMAAWRDAHPDRTLGFEPSCSHGDGSASGVVLDPFAGAGTTGLVALQHGRDFLGIELSPEYAAMARERIETAVRLGFRAPQRGPEVSADQAALFEL